jgi:hypothetical protein
VAAPFLPSLFLTSRDQDLHDKTMVSSGAHKSSTPPCQCVLRHRPMAIKLIDRFRLAGKKGTISDQRGAPPLFQKIERIFVPPIYQPKIPEACPSPRRLFT